MTRKTKRINPELEQWFATTGEQLMDAFEQRCLNAKASMRGNNYETVKDYSFRSAETRTYHDRMVES